MPHPSTSPLSPPSASPPITARVSLRWCNSSSSLRALQFLPEVGERPSVQNVSGLEPRAPCQVHGVLHARQVPGLVAVGREHESGPELLGGGGQRVGQVPAPWGPIELEPAPTAHS